MAKHLSGTETAFGTYFTDEEGNLFGCLRGSVGPHGDSTGEFLKCKTTAPLNELGVETVNNVPVKPWE